MVKRKKARKPYLKYALWLIIALILIGSTYFAYRGVFNYFNQYGCGFPIDKSELGTFGDFISGIVVVPTSLLGFIGILLTIEVTSRQFRRESESTIFFNLLNLHCNKIDTLKFDSDTDFPELESKNRTGFEVFRSLVDEYNVQLRNQFRLHARRIILRRPETISPERFGFIGQRFVDLKLIEYDSEVYFATPETKDLICESIKGKNDGWEFLKDIFEKNPETDNELYLTGISDLNNASPQERKQIFESAFDVLYQNYGHIFGHYFRNLRQVTDFICQSSDVEKFRKILRAQLSRYEIALLAANCLSSFSSEEFNQEIMELNLLKGLYSTDLLIGDGHLKIYSYIRERYQFSEKLNAGLST